jgi:Mg2+-importing ATPase
LCSSFAPADRVLRSRLGKYLSTATLLTVVVTMVLPFTSTGRQRFGYTPLPVMFLVLKGVIVALYILSAEAAKKVFYKKALS